MSAPPQYRGHVAQQAARPSSPRRRRSRETEQHLSAGARGGHAALGQSSSNPGLVGGAPIGDELAERAVRLCDIRTKPAFSAHHMDLRPLRTMRAFLRQRVPEVIRLDASRDGWKTRKSSSSWPFRFVTSLQQACETRARLVISRRARVVREVLFMSASCRLGRHEAASASSGRLALLRPGRGWFLNAITPEIPDLPMPFQTRAGPILAALRLESPRRNHP